MVNEGLLKAFIETYATCTRASIKVLAMQARNTQCLIKHQQPIYKEEDFLSVIEDEGIEYNDILMKLSIY